MRNSVYRINLDIHNILTQVKIIAKRGDSNRRICATLMEHGKPYVFDIRAAHALMRIRKPAGSEEILADCDIYRDGTILYDFTDDTVDTDCILECSIELYLDDALVTSPRFFVEVSDSAYDGSQVITPALQSAINAAGADWVQQHMSSDSIDAWMQDTAAPTIRQWLDEHPDATTSIQDGAVSAQKLAAEVCIHNANEFSAALTSSEDVRIRLANDITLEQTIVIQTKHIWLDLDGHTISKGFSDGPLFWTWPSLSGEEAGDYYERAKKGIISMYNGEIDMGGYRGAVVRCGLLYHSMFANLYVENGVDGFFAYDDNPGGRLSGGNMIHNVRVTRAHAEEYDNDQPNATDAAIGMDIKMNDSIVDSSYTVFYPYGFWVRGNGNTITKCHPWGMPRTTYSADAGTGLGYPLSSVMRVGFICTAQNNKFSECVSDSPDFGSAYASATAGASLLHGGAGFFTNATYVDFTSCHVIPHDQTINKKLVGFYVCDYMVDYADRTINTDRANFSGNITFVSCHAGTTHQYGDQYVYPREQFAEFLHEDVPVSSVSACNFARDYGHERDCAQMVSGDRGLSIAYTNAALPNGVHYVRLGQEMPHVCNYSDTSSNTHPYAVVQARFCKEKDGKIIVPTASALYGNTVMSTLVYNASTDTLTLACFVPSRGRWYLYNGDELPDNRPGAAAWYAPGGENVLKPAVASA